MFVYVFKVRGVRAEERINNFYNMLIKRYGLTPFYPLESEQNVRNTAGPYSQNIQLGDKTKMGFSL